MEFAFSLISIKRIVYLTLIASLACLAAVVFERPESCWVLLGLGLITTHDTFKKQLFTVGITGLMIAVLILIALSIAPFMLPTVFFIIVVTMSCAWLSQYYPDYAFPILLVNILTLFASRNSLTASGPFTVAGHVLLSTVMISLLQFLFWPHFVRNQLRSFTLSVIQNLLDLNREIFNCFMQPEYENNIYLFERRIHLQKLDYLCAITYLRSALTRAEKSLTEEEAICLQNMLAKLELIYEIILDIGQLRRRVSDYTIFAVCLNEITALLQAMDNALLGPAELFSYKTPSYDSIGLTKNIRRFEETYQSVLKVTAREPLAFLLFIYSLNRFQIEVASLHDEIKQIRPLIGKPHRRRA